MAESDEIGPPLRPQSNPIQQIKEWERTRNEPALLNLLEPQLNSVLTRRLAAKALANIARAESASPLAEHLEHEPDRAVRLSLVQALGRLGDDRTLAILLLSLKDWEAVVRLEVASALSRFNSPAAFETLLTALAQQAEPDDRAVRQFAATALGQLADRRAVLPLVAALKDEEGMVRAAAARALGQLGDRSVLPALKRARHTTPHLPGVDCAECTAIDEAIRTMKINDEG